MFLYCTTLILLKNQSYLKNMRVILVFEYLFFFHRCGGHLSFVVAELYFIFLLMGTVALFLSASVNNFHCRKFLKEKWGEELCLLQNYLHQIVNIFIL